MKSIAAVCVCVHEFTNVPNVEYTIGSAGSKIHPILYITLYMIDHSCSDFHIVFLDFSSSPYILLLYVTSTWWNNKSPTTGDPNKLEFALRSSDDIYFCLF